MNDPNGKLVVVVGGGDHKVQSRMTLVNGLLNKSHPEGFTVEFNVDFTSSAAAAAGGGR